MGCPLAIDTRKVTQKTRERLREMAGGGGGGVCVRAARGVRREGRSVCVCASVWQGGRREGRGVCVGVREGGREEGGEEVCACMEGRGEEGELESSPRNIRHLVLHRRTPNNVQVTVRYKELQKKPWSVENTNESSEVTVLETWIDHRIRGPFST